MWVRYPDGLTLRLLTPLLLAAAATLSAADNPLARHPEAFSAGRELYLERCAVCHGQDATGSMAANLIRSRVVASGRDQALFDMIRKGIPGTEMFAHEIPDDSIWRIVTFLHGLARPGDRPPLPGDPARGRELFVQTGCRGCHAVQGRGGFLGPDLSSIALQRTADAIRSAVTEPNATVDTGFRRINVVSKDGRRADGVLRNEDSFSLQVLTREGEHLSFDQSEIASRTDGDSPMPAAAAKLSAADLRDLLAFLDRQRRPYVPDNSGFGNY